MSKLNPQNERVKRDYLRYLKNARGKSEATLDAVRKALSRFEDYTGARDFKTFRREQAIGFKDRLAETNGQRTGETLSLATQSVTLTALKDFFSWLAWQPGFKSKIHVPDIDYFSLSMKDGATAKATKLRDFPSLEQVRAVIAAMPIETVIDRRNRNARRPHAALEGRTPDQAYSHPPRLRTAAQPPADDPLNDAEIRGHFIDPTVLQQDQAMSARRDPVRQTRSQLSGVHQARINPNLATR